MARRSRKSRSVENERKIQAALKSGRISKGDANKLLSMSIMKLERERSASIEQLTEKRRQAQKDFPRLSALRPLGAFTAARGQTGSFGLAGTAAAALTSPVTALREGVGLGEAFQLNRETASDQLASIRQLSPGASTVGDVSAFIGGTPLAGASRAVGRGIAAPIASAAAGKAGAGVVNRIVTQSAANIAGATGSIATAELLNVAR